MEFLFPYRLLSTGEKISVTCHEEGDELVWTTDSPVVKGSLDFDRIDMHAHMEWMELRAEISLQREDGSAYLGEPNEGDAA